MSATGNFLVTFNNRIRSRCALPDNTRHKSLSIHYIFDNPMWNIAFFKLSEKEMIVTNHKKLYEVFLNFFCKVFISTFNIFNWGNVHSHANEPSYNNRIHCDAQSNLQENALTITIYQLIFRHLLTKPWILSIVPVRIWLSVRFTHWCFSCLPMNRSYTAFSRVVVNSVYLMTSIWSFAAFSLVDSVVKWLKMRLYRTFGSKTLRRTDGYLLILHTGVFETESH